MMNIKTHWSFAVSVVPAALCLLGYISLNLTHLNVRFLVVLFWLAILGSLISLAGVRRKRLVPIAATLACWVLLLPAAESMLTWSAWWLNGFAP